MTTSDFDISGSTAELSADDLLREICGDEPAAEGIVADEAEERFEEAKATEASGQESEENVASEIHEGDTGDDSISEVAASVGDITTLDIDDYLAAHTGQYFLYHLETFPNEERFPRPLQVNRERQDIDLTKLASGNADIISRTLKSGVLFIDQLEELQELENAGKMRATVLKDIEKAFTNIDGEFDKWKKEGMTNPWKGRIVSMSWSFLGEQDVHTMLARTEDEERELLATFWALQAVGIRAGYGINGMEDKWVLARSMILAVHSTMEMETGRYSRQGVDIRWKLFPDDMPMQMAQLASVLSINVPPDAAVDADVFGIVEAQDWTSLTAFSAGTVVVEKELFQRAKKYVRV